MSRVTRPITVSLHALGGQGGGVLADWIIAVAGKAGWVVQSTSVPGVAQRTGATVYYLELFPRSDSLLTKQPILALSPLPGDVDLVIASELMEAGRALNRGLVSSRTTLVASTGRIYSISEKSGMGDGRLDPGPIIDLMRKTARQVVAFDMESTATATGSVISAVLLGAVAASNALPFGPEQFDEAIRDAGIAVPSNLAGFAAGYQAGLAPPALATSSASALNASEVVAEGERRLVDYQDTAYVELYHRRLCAIKDLERGEGLLTRELARYLALWMSYEDTVRVADLKTRSVRFARIRQEVAAKPGQIVEIVEFLHPRLQEFCDTMPAAVGNFILQTRHLKSILGRVFAKGRHLRTSTVGGFMLLYCVASLRRWRRSTLRFYHENAKIESWLARIQRVAAVDYAQAVEITRCQRLIKGYGDTYDRGWRNFSRLMEVSEAVDAPTLARLRKAALADEGGRVLDEALRQLKDKPLGEPAVLR